MVSALAASPRLIAASSTRFSCFLLLNRNPLDNIPGHAAPGILSLRCPWIRVPGEALNVLKGHVLIEETGHDRSAPPESGNH
jgi:hypothetical protein